MILEVVVAIIIILLTIVSLYRRRRFTRPYDDTYVVITGCDSGFGRLAAERFDGLGMHVFAGCLQEKNIQELKEKCSERIYPVMLDVTKKADIQGLVCAVRDTIPVGKGLNGLLNNAGITGVSGLLESLESEQYMPAFRVNFFGMVDVTKYLMPFLRKGKGRIINTSSAAGKMATFFIGPYCATKHALEGFSDSLRRELHYDDVSVHVIEPGVFNTEIIFREGYDIDPVKYFQALPHETRGFYGEDMMKRVLKSLDSWKEAADNKLDKVVDAYLHALTSQYPRIRYKVGLDINILFPMVCYLPEWVTDAFIGLQIPVPKAKQNK